VVLIVAGALQAWSNRHAMNPDGVSYLDLARAVSEGGLGDAVNAYWSPLYPWLLGLALVLLRPDAFWEFSVAHAVNLGIFLLTLGAFEFFLTQVLAAREPLRRDDDAEQQVPVWVWRLLGYAAFGWATLLLSGLVGVSPDLLVVMVVFLAAGIIVRLSRHDAGVAWFGWLGAVLALGYLSKGAMLPLSASLMCAAWLSGHPRRWRGLVLTGAVLTMIAGPFVVALSAKQGRLTVGDTGKLNYAWYVNDVPRFKNWNGDPPGSGAAQHATLVLEDPPTHEFSEPVQGTYPLWLDPSYWHEGVIVPFSPERQLRRFAAEIRELPWMVADLFLPVVALFVLRLLGGIAIERRYLLMLGLPLGATIGMYTLVHLEPRFLAGFLGAFVAGTLLFVRPRTRAGRMATLVVMTALAALLSTRVIVMAGGSLAGIRRQAAQGRRAHVEWVRADELGRAGIQEGAKVALIGDGFRAYWAHLAGVRITGEIAAQQFRTANAKGRAAALEALERTPKDAIIADRAGVCEPEQGWTRIPNTDLCVYRPR
jgi:hypothetical protein